MNEKFKFHVIDLEWKGEEDGSVTPLEWLFLAWIIPRMYTCEETIHLSHNVM